ncbi:uncharacterized protein LOC107614099 [Arachis ipaensis]|uniref:uncharacterized protein LOC107614099 n=1 Tax=Arachis ipaensis TaxID=130454 RepID=UPI0007AF7DC9|nr:uncharacterized protein LOC107614099 [Arachis ipaensis]XP_025672908.1 uncharacterized protein LOC112772223 [Arachis hypogaea]
MNDCCFSCLLPASSSFDREKKENKEEPNQAKMFVATRNGLKGKTLDVETQVVIDKLDDLHEAGETPSNVFQKVFGKENPERVRCFGRDKGDCWHNGETQSLFGFKWKN